MHLKILSAKWCPFCPGRDELKPSPIAACIEYSFASAGPELLKQFLYLTATHKCFHVLCDKYSNLIKVSSVSLM